MTDAVERVVNLALFLAAAPVPVTAERIRAEVLGYPEGQDDAAFLRMFERDKDDLKRMGFVVDGDAEGYYRLDSSATYAAAIELTPPETSALRIAGAALADDPSFPFAADLRLALAKISAEVDACDPPVSARLADEDPQRQGETVAVLSSAVCAAEARHLRLHQLAGRLGAARGRAVRALPPRRPLVPGGARHRQGRSRAPTPSRASRTPSPTPPRPSPLTSSGRPTSTSRVLSGSPSSSGPRSSRRSSRSGPRPPGAPARWSPAKGSCVSRPTARRRGG